MPTIDLTPPRTWPSLGWQVIEWIETRLCHGPGDLHGEPIHLDTEWVQFILDAYRLYPKGHKRAGRRVVGYAVASMPKGRAKSEVAGALVCAEFLGPVRFDHWAGNHEQLSPWGYRLKPGEPVGRAVTDPMIKCLATEEGQTGHTYKNVLVMLGHGLEFWPDEFAGIDAGTTRVFRGQGGTEGEILPATAGAASKDGGKETFAVADEPHLYTTPELRDMHDLVRQNISKSRNAAEPWMLATTTMFEPGADSVAEQLYDEAERLEHTKRRSYAFCFHHREGTITEATWDDDEAQLASLREAYGPSASWQDFDRKLENDIRAPGKRISQAARFWHNIKWKSERKAVNLDRWDALADPTRNPKPGDRVVICFDGSERGEHADDTAIEGWALTSPPHLFHIRRWRRPPRAGPEWKIPKREVRAEVTAVASTYRVVRFVGDPSYWREQFDDWDDEFGKDENGDPIVREFLAMRPRDFAPAIDRLLEALDAGGFTHDGSPELREAAANAVLKKPRNSENRVLAKDKEHLKIDDFVAAIYGYDEVHELASKPPAPPPATAPATEPDGEFFRPNARLTI